MGGPPCTNWSAMMNMNWNKMDEREKKKRMEEARLHLRFAVELYKTQMEEGRLFVHEHPWGAKSWLEEEIKELIQKPGVILVKGDQCRFGLMSKEGEVVKKPTGFLTNSPKPPKNWLRSAMGGISTDN